MMPENSMRLALLYLLKPVVRFCLRHSLKFQDVQDAMRDVFVEVAKNELKEKDVSPSVSKISAVTGIQRRQVSRQLESGIDLSARQSLVTRVLGQWRNDKRFCSKSGKPRVLSVEGKSSEFSELAAAVSKDLNPYTLLFELERLEYVERTGNGLRLKAQAHVSKANIKEGFAMLGLDAEDLIYSVEQNILSVESPENLHLRTHYDNVVVDALPEIREWFLKEGAKAHKRARDFLSKYDKDLNPKLSKKKGSARVSFGSFSMTRDD